MQLITIIHVLVLTMTTTAGTSVGKQSFTCENDNNTSVKTYPRPSDAYYDTAINIDSVTITVKCWN